MERLAVVDGRLVDGAGRRVRLRGVCASGLLHMENYMVGFPGTESAMRFHMDAALGGERAERFLDRLQDAMFTEADVQYLAGLGMNVVRLAIGHRALEDPMAPFEYRERALRRLDDVLGWAETAGIHVVLDLHSVPGWQNNDWHGDNPHRASLLWHDRHFQDRLVAMWEALASRYRGRDVVAAFDLMNEPVSGAPFGRFGSSYEPDWAAFNAVHTRLIEAVHRIDPDRVLVVEGDQWGTRFAGIDVPTDNVLFSAHHYHDSLRRAHEYPVDRPDGVRWDIDFHRRLLAAHEGIGWARERDVDLWLGEFGIGYWGGLPASRIRALDDQLTVFEEHDLHWTYWNYKDIGCAGLVHPDPDGPYRTLVDPFVQLKNELCTDPSNSHFIAPDVRGGLVSLSKAIVSRVPAFGDDFAGFTNFLGQAALVNHVAHALQPAWCELFAGLDDGELDALADSFALSNCVVQEPLVATLQRHLPGKG